MGVLHGAEFLVRGFGMWRRRPGLMALGMVPALIALLIVGSALVALLFVVGDLAGWLTGWAGSGALHDVLRLGVAILLVLGALFVATATFTALTLAIGDPFYERIWRATEQLLGGPVPETSIGFWRSARDGLVLALVGLVAGVLVTIIGFVPVVGAVVGGVLAVVVSGRLLAAELLARPLEPRGFDRHARRPLLRAHRWPVLGLGVATQVCFLVPLGAVVVMPAAVVGATMLARELLEPARPHRPAAG